jgi:hypothetical protein
VDQKNAKYLRIILQTGGWSRCKEARLFPTGTFRVGTSDSRPTDMGDTENADLNLDDRGKNLYLD